MTDPDARIPINFTLEELDALDDLLAYYVMSNYGGQELRAQDRTDEDQHHRQLVRNIDRRVAAKLRAHGGSRYD